MSVVGGHSYNDRHHVFMSGLVSASTWEREGRHQKIRPSPARMNLLLGHFPSAIIRTRRQFDSDCAQKFTIWTAFISEWNGKCCVSSLSDLFTVFSFSINLYLYFSIIISQYRFIVHDTIRIICFYSHYLLTSSILTKLEFLIIYSLWFTQSFSSKLLLFISAFIILLFNVKFVIIILLLVTVALLLLLYCS